MMPKLSREDAYAVDEAAAAPCDPMVFPLTANADFICNRELAYIRARLPDFLI